MLAVSIPGCTAGTWQEHSTEQHVAPAASEAEGITARKQCVWLCLIQDSRGTAAVVTHSRLLIPENEVSKGSYLSNFSLKVIRGNLLFAPATEKSSRQTHGHRALGALKLN